MSIEAPKDEGSKDTLKFSDGEKHNLLQDGAVVYLLEGQTIGNQQKAGRSFWYVTNGGEQLLELPSKKIEVAIYPDPERFFVPNTGGKDLQTIEKLLQEDARALRKRLKLRGIEEIIPKEASTLTELFFQHVDSTGSLLFGPDYGYLYGITKNLINEAGSRVANVGSADIDHGLCVRGWFHGIGNAHVYAVRLVVPQY